jgi:hypothetical protein
MAITRNYYQNNSFLILATIILVTACKNKECPKISTQVSVYQEVIKEIKSAEFRYIDSIKIDSSILLASASYYSCDKKIGYFIWRRPYGTEFYCMNMPIHVWTAFKESNNKEVFYETQISGRFKAGAITQEIQQ